jgi:hypothetical protein
MKLDLRQKNKIWWKYQACRKQFASLKLVAQACMHLGVPTVYTANSVSPAQRRNLSAVRGGGMLIEQIDASTDGREPVSFYRLSVFIKFLINTSLWIVS